MRTKHAHVFRMGSTIFAVVTENGQKVGEFDAPTQAAVVDWLEEEHFDITSLRIETAR